MSTKTKESIVQLIMTKPIYKKVAWIIPIERLSGNNFLTGQDLTYDKMTGKVPLTEEEKKKYPFIIDPTANYPVPDRQSYNITVDELGIPVDPRGYYLYKLILISNEVAKNKIDYDINPIKYIGYFYDKESEAKRGNEIDDIRYEAETLVREAGLDLRKKVALLLNYKVPDKDFFINLTTVSDDILKRELVKVSRDHPELLMSCFPVNNPGIENELFVVELLHYKIINQKPDGDIYYGVNYLGRTIEEVTKSFTKQDMQPNINKWGIQLQELKGSRPMTERTFLPPTSKDTVNQLPPIDRLQELTTRLKAAVFDEDYEGAKGFMSGIREVYKEVVRSTPGYEFPFEKFEKQIEGLRKPLKPTNGERDKFEILTLSQIQKKIMHHLSKYSKDECEGFWDDREKLIDYMVNK